jgi:hypothetical protein
MPMSIGFQICAASSHQHGDTGYAGDVTIVLQHKYTLAARDLGVDRDGNDHNDALYKKLVICVDRK